MLELLGQILVVLLLLVGSFFLLVGSYGLAKLPSLMQRLHAPTKSSTLGLGGLLLASMLEGWLRSGRLSLAELFDEDMLGDDLEDWLHESQLMRRTFRNTAIISGLIERRHPGKEKTGRQVTVSSDVIYDVLYEHEPDHILIQATRRDAARGLLDIERLGHLLARIRQHIVHKPLDRISPLAVPILLDIGKTAIFGEARESAMADAAEELMKEALGQIDVEHRGTGRARR